MPQISVIVPVYKVEPYLRRCVDSILAQTFTDFELILVDDGSPDGCGVICDEYAAKDQRVHVIHQANGGLSAARNAGIDWAFANSDSQWISFIDSDDWVHPCYLDYLFHALQEYKTNISACGYVRVEEEKEYHEIPYHVSQETWDQFYVEDWGRGVVACCKLYAKEVFGNLRFPVGRINEDEFLTYKLLHRAGKLAVLDAELYYYFRNPKGIMKTRFSPKKLDVLIALRQQYRFAKRNRYMRLYIECQKRSFRRCIEYLRECSRENGLSNSEKRRTISFLHAQLRSILLKNGNTIAPIKTNRWIYEEAFPLLSWLYWVCKGILGKIKRLNKKK